ncbi:hypothetical protein SRHO_G00058790 [Serrasalmus rhombeus]
MFFTAPDLTGMLENTMKAADKAIVAKSFGKWQSSSQRSRTMEKPDEPSEGTEEASCSSSTCESPKKGKKRPPQPLFLPPAVALNLQCVFFSRLTGRPCY